MTPDENWKEVKILSEDLSALLGVSEKSTKEFLTTLENLIIHRLTEQVSLSEETHDVEYSIELPYLGTLVVSVEGPRDLVSLSFVARNSFYRKVRKACHHQESSLNSQVASQLGEHLVNLFEKGED